jgi:hypothetical protein
MSSDYTKSHFAMRETGRRRAEGILLFRPWSLALLLYHIPRMRYANGIHDHAADDGRQDRQRERDFGVKAHTGCAKPSRCPDRNQDAADNGGAQHHIPNYQFRHGSVPHNSCVGIDTKQVLRAVAIARETKASSMRRHASDWMIMPFSGVGWPSNCEPL